MSKKGIDCVTPQSKCLSGECTWLACNTSDSPIETEIPMNMRIEGSRVGRFGLNYYGHADISSNTSSIQLHIAVDCNIHISGIGTLNGIAPNASRDYTYAREEIISLRQS